MFEILHEKQLKCFIDYQKYFPVWFQLSNLSIDK